MIWARRPERAEEWWGGKGVQPAGDGCGFLWSVVVTCPMETVTGDLYEDDFLLWSESQATLLRRLAAGERVNDRDLDWANLGEEIEAVGRGELGAFESLLTQAIVHRLKQECWPDFGRGSALAQRGNPLPAGGGRCVLGIHAAAG
jgi:hypothetical protein